MKTKKQNLLLISHERKISNKIHAVIKELYDVRQLTFSKDAITADNVNSSEIILLVGLQSPEDIYAKLKVINQLPSFPPIVLISDINCMQFLAQTLSYGVVRFVSVPLDLMDLINTINQLLKKVKVSSVPTTSNALEGVWKKFKPMLNQLALDENPGIINKTGTFDRLAIPENVGFLKVDFFGKFRINLQNQFIENLFSKKTKSMLAYMLYHHKKPICRDKLISIFWPYHDPTQAKNNLNVAIHKIKKDFLRIFPDAPIFRLDNDCYVFNTNFIIETDVEKFELNYRHSKAIVNTVNATSAIEEFQAVIDLYQGDFLERIYEPWIEQKRDHYRELYLNTLNHLSTIFFQLEQFLEAIKYNKLMLEKDACMEVVHRKLMICYHSIGRHAKVMRQYQKCEKIMKEELGMTPSKKTMALLETLTE